MWTKFLLLFSENNIIDREAKLKLKRTILSWPKNMHIPFISVIKRCKVYWSIKELLYLDKIQKDFYSFYSFLKLAAALF